MKKHIVQEIEIVANNNLTFEEQIKRVEKINNIFVDIAANYHIQKIKNKTNKKGQNINISTL